MPGAPLPQHPAIALHHPFLEAFHGAPTQACHPVFYHSDLDRDDHYRAAEGGSQALPKTCAFCERVTQDGESWYQQSGYEYSPGRLTHGVCPSCRARFGG